jgi:hypothetical protein
MQVRLAIKRTKHGGDRNHQRAVTGYRAGPQPGSKRWTARNAGVGAIAIENDGELDYKRSRICVKRRRDE